MVVWQWLVAQYEKLNDRLNRDGQGLVEYALILVLVAVVVIVILTALGPSISEIFENILENI